MEEFRPQPGSDSLKVTVSRLYSQDANDRVKAAAELGEIGTEEEAPELLKVAYEDEASTVRQMAIQAYAEIMEEDAIDELVRAANDHFDEYVRMYAITAMGRIGTDAVAGPLSSLIYDSSEKLQGAALRAMIHAETSEQGDAVFELFKQEDLGDLAARNCLEALALWTYEDAKDYIKTNYFENIEDYSLEIQTFVAFYLAVSGYNPAEEFLKTQRLDEYIRIKIEDEHYRGRKGLLDAISMLK